MSVPEWGVISLSVDTLPLNLAVLDSDGEILFTNKAWQDFAADNGLAVRPDTVGMNYLEITEQADDETAQTIAAGLRELLSGERDLVEIEYPFHSPTEKRWFLMRAAPFTVGDARYVSVVHLDITERVEAEHDVNRFRRAVETAGHAIFHTDTDGTITYVNPGFEAVTGFQYADAVGRTPNILKSGETPAEVYQTLWETILSGNVWEGVLINRRKSGELYYAHQSIAPVVDNENEVVGYLAIQTDITTLQESNSQLQKLGNLLRHDIRNQLNIIQGRADLLSNSNDSAATNAAAIIEATDRLLSVTEKAREMVEFLSAETTLSPRNLSPVVQAAVETVRPQYPDASIQVDVADDSVALCVESIGSAIAELLRNALSHNTSEIPELNVSVDRGIDWITIRIADNGIGIPAIEYETLESQEASQVYHDTGVGLNFVYWVVRRSGGQIRFEENTPQGTIASVRLPRPDQST